MDTYLPFIICSHIIRKTSFSTNKNFTDGIDHTVDTVASDQKKDNKRKERKNENTTYPVIPVTIFVIKINFTN